MLLSDDESTTLRGLSCNYCRAARSGDGLQLAAPLAGGVGVFRTLDVSQQAGRAHPTYTLPTPAGSDTYVCDVAWSPMHVGKGRHLAVAWSGNGGIAVWEVPGATALGVSPVLLHSVPPTHGLTLRSVDWHPSALPSLVAWHANGPPAALILPRRGKDAARHTLQPSAPSSSASTSSSSLYTIGTVSSASHGGKRVYAVNRHTRHLCIFHDPLRSAPAQVIIYCATTASPHLSSLLCRPHQRFHAADARQTRPDGSTAAGARHPCGIEHTRGRGAARGVRARGRALPRAVRGHGQRQPGEPQHRCGCAGGRGNVGRAARARESSCEYSGAGASGRGRG